MGPACVETARDLFLLLIPPWVNPFIDGEDRMQPALLPHCLEDYVDEDNPVRVIEIFVEELDLATLGFSGMRPAATGPPAYHPSTLLKIYLYGYLNRLQSSRRLEREAQRNIELMWLTGRLMPDFKTIADFRKDNGAAIRAALCTVRGSVPPIQPVHAGCGGARWQPLQGGQQPRQELHRGQGRQAGRTGGSQHRALSHSPRPRRPPGRRRGRSQDRAPHGEDRGVAPADAFVEGDG